MSEPVIIFRDLPATFPERDKYKKPSIISSVVFHGLLILTVVVVPLLVPKAISERELLITLVSPIAPPPAAPPPPPAAIAAAPAPKIVKAIVPSGAQDILITPTAIPNDVAVIFEEPIAPTAGVIGGVPGGIPGGVIGGVLGGILASNSVANAIPAMAPAPPPPPPPPKPIVPMEPVRVGGAVREPRLVKMIPPVYPSLASKARVSGTVVLEATVTEQGAVDAIRVISGHPLLTEAAINCLKQWQYEPTLLNGIPVPVILTARINFLKTPLS
jgi:protein TonB